MMADIVLLQNQQATVRGSSAVLKLKCHFHKRSGHAVFRCHKQGGIPKMTDTGLHWGQYSKSLLRNPLGEHMQKAQPAANLRKCFCKE